MEIRLDIADILRVNIITALNKQKPITSIAPRPRLFLLDGGEAARDEGLIHLIQVDLDQNRPLGEKFGITAIPTLLFFKDGKLLEGTIEAEGQPLVQNGIMVGAAPENTLREIISKM